MKRFARSSPDGGRFGTPSGCTSPFTREARSEFKPKGLRNDCRSQPVVGHDMDVDDVGLVGRRDALARLRAVVAGAVAGRGRLVLLNGEAGIGKTTLAAAVAEHAASAGAETLWASCWD